MSLASVEQTHVEAVGKELALQIECLAIRHQTQRGIPLAEVATRMQRIEQKWDAPLDPREDALIYRTWFEVDGKDVPYPNVQVRLTGAHVFVETMMRAGLRCA